MSASTSIQSVSFSGHESFPLRFAWLAKAVRHLGGTIGSDLFGREDAVVLLGVGKNMVRSIRHWATRAGVIESQADQGRAGRYAPTSLGHLLFGPRGADPYLEDQATIWLVHWQLCSNPECTTWYWMFNECRQPSFTLDEAVADLMRVAEGAGGKKPARGTVERDVSCFIRMYVPSEPDRRLSKEDTYDSPLTELALLHKEPESGRVFFDRAHRPMLPPEVFAHATLAFWQRFAQESSTLSFERLAYGPGSPGQVFKLTENACVEFLESLELCTQGALSFTTTAGLRQLICTRRVDPLSLVKCYYDGLARIRDAT
jgi:hypothetical protein